MPSLKHVHTYVKYKSRKGYFRCAAPGCTWTLDKERVEGQPTLCTCCGTQFNLTKEDLKRVKPRCLNCSNTKKARVYQKAQQITNTLSGNESLQPPLKEHPEQEEFPEPDFRDFSYLFPDDPKEEEEPEHDS